MQKAWGETAGWLEVLKADCHFNRAAKRESGKREQGRFNHPNNCLKSPHNFSSLSLQNKIGKIKLKLHR